MPSTAPPRLTSFSHGAGCACKLGQAELAQVLGSLPRVTDPRLLVGAAEGDDAAVWLDRPGRALVATTDFLTPIVDDARAWGAIAAANALSDIYAMGGTPLFALSLVGWHRDALPLELLQEVLAGAAEVAAEARCPVVGGHSVDDREPKFGLAVLGEADPDRLLTHRGVRPGDALVLTKPLGTGILTTALKRDAVTMATLAPAVASMRTLNASAAAVALRHGVRAATDVTGFGLLGHLGNLLRASGVAAELWLDALPVLPGALEMAAVGMVPGGTVRNLTAADGTEFASGIAEAERMLCADAQTSGGLLLAVPFGALEALRADLRAAGAPAAAWIGRAMPGVAGRCHVTRLAQG